MNHATGLMSDTAASHPSRMASRGMAPPPAKGSRTRGARPPNAARTSSRSRASSGEDSRPQWRTPPVVSSFSPRPAAFLATRPPIRCSSSRRPSPPGSSSRVASSTARLAARGRRAGQTCRVETCPWRTFFSWTESMETCLRGKAASMRRRPSLRSLTGTAPAGKGFHDRSWERGRPARTGGEALGNENLITYKAQESSCFQSVIPCHSRGSGRKAGIQEPLIEVDSRFRGNDGCSGACARVSIDPRAQAELCA